MKGDEKPNTSQQPAISVEDMKDKDSETLAAHIVAYRHLGVNKKLAVICMQILAQREKDGDEFDYKQFIEDKLSQMHRTSMNDKDKNMMRSLFKMDFNKM